MLLSNSWISRRLNTKLAVSSSTVHTCMFYCAGPQHRAADKDSKLTGHLLLTQSSRFNFPCERLPCSRSNATLLPFSKIAHPLYQILRRSSTSKSPPPLVTHKTTSSHHATLTFLYPLLLPVELVEGRFLEQLLHEDLRSEARLVYIQWVLLLKGSILIYAIVHS